jgi:hypothetical protein
MEVTQDLVQWWDFFICGVEPSGSAAAVFVC